MLHRILFVAALTLLLGFSQQSALLHGISHLADLDPISGQMAGDEQDQNVHQVSHCDHCLGFSHLANAINHNHSLLFASTPHETPNQVTGLVQPSQLTFAYSARAPPASI